MSAVYTWGYCPECGSKEIHHEEGTHKQCKLCSQEWFSDVDYSGVVAAYLAERRPLLGALEVLAKQMTPEEYESEEGEPADSDTLAEAYELMVLGARGALARLRVKLEKP
jgi:hypothetical protein